MTRKTPPQPKPTDPGYTLDHDEAVQYLAERFSITREQAEQKLLEAVNSNSFPVMVQLEDGNWIKLSGELAVQFMEVEYRNAPHHFLF